jgi:hypothetical protein
VIGFGSAGRVGVELATDRANYPTSSAVAEGQSLREWKVWR